MSESQPTAFRTNRRTKRVYPISGTTTPSLDDIIATKSGRTQKEYVKFATDRLNSLKPKAPGSENPERYNGWYNYDTWATNLILTNHQSSQRWLDAWRDNWRQKMKGGRFVPEAAEFAVWKYLIPAAQGKGPWAKHFTEVEKYQGGLYTPQEDIDRSKVNYKEIVDAILEE